MLGSKLERLLTHITGSFVDGIASHHGAAAGKGARAPIELVGVTRDDINLIHAHAKLLRHDLREAREVTLSLRAHARNDRDTPTAHHLHLRAFIWTNTCPFHISDNSYAHMFAFGA